MRQQLLLENINIVETRELTLNNILLSEGSLNLQKIIKPEKIIILSKQLQNKSNIKDMKKLNKLLKQAIPNNLSSPTKLKGVYDKLYKKNNDFSSIYSLLSKAGLSKDQSLVGSIVLFLSGTKFKVKKDISPVKLLSIIIATGVKKIASSKVSLDKKVLITIGTKLTLDFFNNQKINLNKNRSFKEEDKEIGTEFATSGFFDFGKNMTSDFNPDKHLTPEAKEEFEKTSDKNMGKIYSIKSDDIIRSPNYKEPLGQKRHEEYGKYAKPMSPGERRKHLVDTTFQTDLYDRRKKEGGLNKWGEKALERERKERDMWDDVVNKHVSPY